MAAITITAATFIASDPSTAIRVTNNDGSPTRSLEAFAAGQVAYKGALGTYGLATCTGISPLCEPVGFFENSGGTGQVCSIVSKDPAAIIGNAPMTIGKVYVLGATPGAVNPNSDETTGWKKTVLGVAMSTSVLSISLSPVPSPAMA